MISTMKFPRARLLVFAKAPVPGRVKTRLAPRYGTHGAAGWYREMVHHTLAQATAARLCPLELWCAPDSHHGFFHSCRHRYRLTLKRQQGNDLGRRMHYALSRALRDCDYALLIGTDCVSLTPADLTRALDWLDRGKEVVLGPAQDGGYVLIGLRRPQPALFRAIRWGTPAVLQATRRRIRLTGLDSAELPPQWDVDYPADLLRWRRRVRSAK
jgi:rSAM/selenodomain-associated transferase 1